MTRLNRHFHRLRTVAALTMATASMATVFASPQFAADQQKPADPTLTRQSQVRALPGQLDDVLMVNDNNPELITGEGATAGLGLRTGAIAAASLRISSVERGSLNGPFTRKAATALLPSGNSIKPASA